MKYVTLIIGVGLIWLHSKFGWVLSENEAIAAPLEFAAAADERKKLVDIEIEKMKAEALVEAAKRWDGKVPHYLGGGGENFLLNLQK